MGLLIKLGYKDLGYIPSKESQAFGKWITEATEIEFGTRSLRKAFFRHALAHDSIDRTWRQSCRPQWYPQQARPGIHP